MGNRAQQGSTQGYMLNWGSEKKTFAENEEAFKNFDHMLEFDHVSYQMCVPRTSAKSETSMVENPYVDNGWAERTPKLAPQGQLWYLPFQAVCQRDEDRRMRCCV
ncbi:Adenylosuccinate synthetase [Trichinella pseudospiralis]